MNDIGATIAKLRKEAGLTQKSLAEMVGVGRLAVAHYEQGVRLPSLDILQKMATALGKEIPITIKPLNK